MNKAQSEAAHFRRRLRLRYGLVVNHAEYRELCRAAAEAPVIQRRTLRISTRLVSIKGFIIPCIYDGVRFRLVTVLSPASKADKVPA